MKKIGLKDIASHVGVSTALVSYVLNGQAEEKQVGKEIAEKIKQAAEELNYRPNQLAKSLKTRKSNTIGLIVADINYRFSSGITRAIEAEAKRKNYTVIFGSSNESSDKFNELVNVLINHQVDGLILVPVEHSEASIASLQKSDLPFVLIDRNFPNMITNCVLLDNYKAAYDSTTHLINQGHKKIAFINYNNRLFNLQERNRGYIAALEDHGIEPHPAWSLFVRQNHYEQDMRKAIHQLTSGSKCDAIFFATDRLAISGLKEIVNLKIKVPEELSVFSFDESEAFELFSCPVSHARQPLEKMGKIAVNMLLDLVNKPGVVNQIYLETELVAAKSCRE
ncbi:LacI family DNA-binding transcriptional regulator [Mucilaginibacter celer]|uniref:LacI family DNA-binding transcriptional regulator n=1 Tax=Mucilaginibacter celer TaxID=2305508 RepID=A0A494VVZ5_9SPHI|nr:LacI family DNA-binding transcriptional regulator [Mucilaginibacter celer]AYL95633.1 LacI family DNA-binding transcriptional regulator [Mucilaginibacter celer]